MATPGIQERPFVKVDAPNQALPVAFQKK